MYKKSIGWVIQSRSGFSKNISHTENEDDDDEDSDTSKGSEADSDTYNGFKADSNISNGSKAESDSDINPDTPLYVWGELNDNM